jgi:hypothetical protein
LHGQPRGSKQSKQTVRRETCEFGATRSCTGNPADLTGPPVPAGRQRIIRGSQVLHGQPKGSNRIVGPRRPGWKDIKQSKQAVRRETGEFGATRSCTGNPADLTEPPVPAGRQRIIRGGQVSGDQTEPLAPAGLVGKT